MDWRRLTSRPELLLVLAVLLALVARPGAVPVGIAGLGVVAGAVLGLQAMAIALLYSRTRVLSFAQFGLGAGAAMLFYLWVLYNQWAVLANGVCHCLAPHGISMSQLQHNPDVFRLYLQHRHPWVLPLNALISATIGIALATETGRQLHKWIVGIFVRAPRIVPTLATLAFAGMLTSGAASMLSARTTKWFGFYPFHWFPYGPRPGTGI
ncbi:MAG TPA: hypothetical protein VFH54_11990, partial [Mycobacteriales bacterium]|nr:hypothetical protein [Mycobacteriales bacterium]